MIRENWAFWLLLLMFIGKIIDMFMRAAGCKRTYSWDADLTGRLTGIVMCILFGIIYAIALGWL